MTVAPSKDDSLRFACPRCMTWLKVSPKLAGKRRRCPRCHLVLDVPRQTQPKRQSGAYPLSQETGPLPVAQPVYVPVTCEVCQTRMYSTIEQVGQRIICPECGTPAIVPATANVEEPAAPPVTAEGYLVFEEAAPAPAPPDPVTAQGPLIRVTCSLCGTLMYADEEQMGQAIVCPDCGVATVVRRPAEGLGKKPFRTAGEIGDYRVPGWDDTRPQRSGPQSRPPPPPLAKRPPPKAGEKGSDSRGGRPVLPRWPLLSGTFTFPFAPSARAVAFVLAAWAALPVGAYQECVKLAASGDARALFLSAIYGGVAVILAVMWMAFSSACALTIVRDTANGSDEIPSWPDMAFLDWMLDPLYLIDGACVEHDSRHWRGLVSHAVVSTRSQGGGDRSVLHLSDYVAVDARTKLALRGNFAGCLSDLLDGVARLGDVLHTDGRPAGSRRRRGDICAFRRQVV